MDTLCVCCFISFRDGRCSSPTCAITRFAMGRKIAGALSCFCLLFPACAITRFAMGRKIAGALSCECRRTTFFGAAFGLSPLLWMRFSAFMPYCLHCAAPVVATRRMGLCPKPRKGSALDPLGLCPRPRQGYRALDCGIRFAFGFTTLFVPPTVYLCRPHTLPVGGVGCRGTPLSPLLQNEYVPLSSSSCESSSSRYCRSSS